MNESFKVMFLHLSGIRLTCIPYIVRIAILKYGKSIVYNRENCSPLQFIEDKTYKCYSNTNKILAPCGFQNYELNS